MREWVIATQPVVWKRQSPKCGSCAPSRGTVRELVMSTELESSNFHFYTMFKLFNNASPSEVSEASQADSDVCVYEIWVEAKDFLTEDSVY